MKKGIIAVAALAAAAGVSTAAFFIVKDKDTKEKKQAAEKLAENEIFRFDADSINTVEINSPEGDYSFVIENEKWVNSPDSGNSFALDQTKPQQICTTLSALKADTNYGEADDESKAKYGLDDPYVVTVGDGSKSYTLNIGDVSPTGNYYYAMADGNNKIYAVQSADITTLLYSRFDLIDSSVVPYSDAEITGIRLKRDGEEIYDLTLDPETRTWTLPSEYSMLTVNQTRPDTIVTVLARLSAAQLVEENASDLSQYGLDAPYAELTVKGSDGKTHTLLLSRYGRESSKMTYILIKESGLIGQYYTSDLDFIDYDLFDLVLQNVESANMFNISEFEFSCAEASDKFTLDAKAGTAECRGTAIDLTKAEVMNMFTNFYNSFSYITISDIDVKAKPELKEPVLSARYVLNSGEESKVDLVSAGEGTECYVFVNGKYSGTKTDSSFISGNSSMMSYYDSLCELTGLDRSTP